MQKHCNFWQKDVRRLYNVPNIVRKIFEILKFVKFGSESCIFPQFCKSDMSKYGYLEVFQRIHSTLK